MIAWLAARWRSITRQGQFMPRERKYLLALSVVRAGVTAGGALGLFLVQFVEGWPPWAMALTFVPNALLGALVSADLIEHWLRGLPPPFGLGFSFNPFISAIGELEGWMGPVNALGDDGQAAVAAWEQMKCGPPPKVKETGAYVLPWWGMPGTESWCK